MIINLNKIYYYILFCLIITCCTKNKDNYVIYEKKVPEVNQIDIFDDINLVLYPDTIYMVKIETNENIISKIKIDTLEGSLHIENNNKYNWMRYNDSITLHVFFGNKPLKIHSHGTGKITSFDTLKTSFIRFYAFNGAGEYEVKIISAITSVVSHSYSTTDFYIIGKTNLISSHAKGMGKMYLQNLEAKKANIIYDGTNEYYVNVTEELNVTLKNIGNIFYKGNPKIIKIERIGKGELIPLE